MPKKYGKLVLYYEVDSDGQGVCVTSKEIAGYGENDNVLSILMSAMSAECDDLNQGIKDGNIKLGDTRSIAAVKMVSDFMGYMRAEENGQAK